MPPPTPALTLSRPSLKRHAWRAVWRAFQEAYAAAKARRTAARELRAMGELECKDLGIGRGEVEYLLRAPAERRLPPHWPS